MAKNINKIKEFFALESNLKRLPPAAASMVSTIIAKEPVPEHYYEYLTEQYKAACNAPITLHIPEMSNTFGKAITGALHDAVAVAAVGMNEWQKNHQELVNKLKEAKLKTLDTPQGLYHVPDLPPETYLTPKHPDQITEPTSNAADPFVIDSLPPELMTGGEAYKIDTTTGNIKSKVQSIAQEPKKNDESWLTKALGPLQYLSGTKPIKKMGIDLAALTPNAGKLLDYDYTALPHKYMAAYKGQQSETTSHHFPFGELHTLGDKTFPTDYPNVSIHHLFDPWKYPHETHYMAVYHPLNLPLSNTHPDKLPTVPEYTKQVVPKKEYPRLYAFMEYNHHRLMKLGSRPRLVTIIKAPYTKHRLEITAIYKKHEYAIHYLDKLVGVLRNGRLIVNTHAQFDVKSWHLILTRLDQLEKGVLWQLVKDTPALTDPTLLTEVINWLPHWDVTCTFKINMVGSTPIDFWDGLYKKTMHEQQWYLPTWHEEYVHAGDWLQHV